jgi:hypothetical protein
MISFPVVELLPEMHSVLDGFVVFFLSVKLYHTKQFLDIILYCKPRSGKKFRILCSNPFKAKLNIITESVQLVESLFVVSIVKFYSDFGESVPSSTANNVFGLASRCIRVLCFSLQLLQRIKK